MSDAYNWDKYLKGTQANNCENNQVKNISDTTQNELSEILSHLSPDDGMSQDLAGTYLYQQYGIDGFSIYDAWYKRASHYPGSEKAKDEFEEFSRYDKYPMPLSNPSRWKKSAMKPNLRILKMMNH